MSSPLAGQAGPEVQILQRVGDVLPIEQIFPVQAVVLGGAVLVAIVVFHGTLMRTVQAGVARNEVSLRATPSSWRVDLVMGGVVFALLTSALVEVVVWTAALKYSGLYGDWVSAAAYAATNYTTLGDVRVPPPAGWHMLGPIIAISGLFTFGWTGSVLVDVVGRLGRVRDLLRADPPAQERPAPESSRQGA